MSLTFQFHTLGLLDYGSRAPSHCCFESLLVQGHWTVNGCALFNDRTTAEVQDGSGSRRPNFASSPRPRGLGRNRFLSSRDASSERLPPNPVGQWLNDMFSGQQRCEAKLRKNRHLLEDVVWPGVSNSPVKGAALHIVLNGKRLLSRRSSSIGLDTSSET